MPGPQGQFSKEFPVLSLLSRKLPPRPVRHGLRPPPSASDELAVLTSLPNSPDIPGRCAVLATQMQSHLRLSRGYFFGILAPVLGP